MATLSPFETQRRSQWGQRMLAAAKCSFGHKDLPWYKRAMLAMAVLNLEGKEVTANYLRDRVAKVIGHAPNRSHVSTLIKHGIRTGLLRPTGRKIAVDGYQRHPSYIVTGRMRRVDRSTRLYLESAEET